jgi:hypothetical protein
MSATNEGKGLATTLTRLVEAYERAYRAKEDCLSKGDWAGYEVTEATCDNLYAVIVARIEHAAWDDLETEEAEAQLDAIMLTNTDLGVCWEA